MDFCGTAKEGKRENQGSQEEIKRKVTFLRHRSFIQAPVKHKKVVKGLGFTRLNQIVEREDTPSIRGMVNAVPHLVRIVEN